MGGKSVGVGSGIQEANSMKHAICITAIAFMLCTAFALAEQPPGCGDNCIVFASSRAGHYPIPAHHGNDYGIKATHIYRATIVRDGK